EFPTKDGSDRDLRTFRRTSAEQVERISHALAEAFPPEIKITRPAGGFVLWVELPKSVSALKLHELALAEKISIAPGPMFSAKQSSRTSFALTAAIPGPAVWNPPSTLWVTS